MSPFTKALKRIGNNSEEEVGEAALLGRTFLVLCDDCSFIACCSVETISRSQKIANNQSYAKRDCADHFEIDERLDENATKLPQIADLSEAEYDCAEDDRPYHEAQHGHERVAERLHGSSQVGRDKAKNDSQAYSN